MIRTSTDNVPMIDRIARPTISRISRNIGPNRVCPSFWPDFENWLLIMTPPVAFNSTKSYFDSISARRASYSWTIVGTSTSGAMPGRVNRICTADTAVPLVGR